MLRPLIPNSATTSTLGSCSRSKLAEAAAAVTADDDVGESSDPDADATHRGRQRNLDTISLRYGLENCFFSLSMAYVLSML